MSRSRSRTRHPVHPVTAHIPIAFLSIGSLFDVVAGFADGPWKERAFTAIAVGLVGSLPAIATGLAEYVRIPRESPYVRVATTHMALMLAAVAAFGVSFAMRLLPATGLSSGAPWVSVFGTGMLVVGGWYGGALVYHHGHSVRGSGTGSEEEPR